MKLLENVVNSSLKIIKTGWKDKKVKEGYAIYGIGLFCAGLLYLNKQHLVAGYTTRITNIFLFVNVCHHAFVGINNSYQKL